MMVDQNAVCVNSHQYWIEEAEGMSDLSMYEVEDIWDDFDRSDDHIVPQPSNDSGSGNSCEGHSYKKRRREVTPVLSNAGNLCASNGVCQGKEETDSTGFNNKINMLEKNPWSHMPDGEFAASRDGVTAKDMPNLTYNETRMPNHCFKSTNVTSIGSDLCADDVIINDTSTAGDSSSYGYPPSVIPQTDNLSFLDNDCEDKESSDLLYYGWPDIGNSEDMDRMLRSCDSSFELGVTGSEEELGWFTSDDPIGRSEGALNLDFRFPCLGPSALKNISEDHGPPELNDEISCYISESKHVFKLKDQVGLQKKQPKHQSHTEGKKIGQGLGNGGSLHRIGDLKNNDIQHSSIDASDLVFTSIGNQLHKRNLELNSFCYQQNNTSYLNQDYGHAPNQTTAAPMLAGINFENKDLTSTSPKESSYASNQVQSTESSGDPSFWGTAAKVDELENVHHSHGFHPSFTRNTSQMGMMIQASIYDPVAAQKQLHVPANQHESQSDAEGIQKRASADVGSVPESSSFSPGLDEGSLEATSFRQLQQVMDQLDSRTKLCIRDSLYRLARCAEQRHSYANICGSTADYRASGGPLMTEGTCKVGAAPLE